MHRTPPPLILAALLLTACTAGEATDAKSDDTAGDTATDSGTDSGTDTATDSGTDTATDSGTDTAATPDGNHIVLDGVEYTLGDPTLALGDGSVAISAYTEDYANWLLMAAPATAGDHACNTTGTFVQFMVGSAVRSTAYGEGECTIRVHVGAGTTGDRYALTLSGTLVDPAGSSPAAATGSIDSTIDGVTAR